MPSRGRGRRCRLLASAVALATVAAGFVSVEPTLRAAAAVPSRGGVSKGETPPSKAPSAPLVASVAGVGLGVLVNWVPDAASTHVTSYSVTATPASSSSTKACPAPASKTVSVPSADTSVVVGGLCAFVVYRARVVAVNPAGSSARSRASSPAVPLVAEAPDAPLILSVTGREGKLLVDWSAPDYDGGDQLRGYTLTARHASQVVRLMTSPSATSATLRGLTNGDSYDVSLTASSTAGTSTASTQTGTPSLTYTPSPPVGLTSVPNGHGAVTVSWGPPADDGGGTVTSYAISYRQEVQSHTGVWSAKPGAPLETVHEAAPATSVTVRSFPVSPAFYLFSVTATNSAGTGQPAVAPAPVTPTTAAKSTTVVFDKASVSALSAVSSNTLVWDDPAPSEVTSVKVGDVVACQPGGLLPYGMLRRVLGVTDDGSTYTLSTTQATFSQAVTDMSLASSVEAGSVVPGAGAAGSYKAVFVPSSSGVSLHGSKGNGTVGDDTTWSVDVKNGFNSVAVQFSMSVKVGIDIDVQHGFLDVPGGVSVSALGKASFDVQGTVGIEDTNGGESPFQEEIGELDLKAIPFDVVVPSEVEPKVPVYLKVSGNASIGFHATMTVGAALWWSSSDAGHLGGKSLSQAPKLTGGPVPGLVASGSVFDGLSIQPQLDIDGVAGPDFEANYGMEATINAGDDPFFQLGPFLQLSVGFACDLFLCHDQINDTFAQFDYAGFTIPHPPAASYTITPADPSIAPGKHVNLSAVRSDGKSKPLKWSLIGNTRGDTITSSGTLTVASPPERFLTVRVTDSTGAVGETTVMVGTEFDPPGDLTVSQPGHGPFTVSLTWQPPASTGGFPITGYQLLTEPATTSTTTAAMSTTLTKLSSGTYDVDVYAINSDGLASPPTSTTFSIGNNGELVTSPGLWTPSEAPLAANAAKHQGDDNDGLVDLACPSAGSCTAVGDYEDRSGSDDGLIETLSGGTWTATEAPAPDDGTGAVDLFDVACPASGWCTATADYYVKSRGDEPLIETLSSGTWRSTEVPLPANAANYQFDDDGLVDLACPSAGSCTAVGQYTNASGGDDGLIETLSGGTWTPKDAPLPANAAKDDNQDAELLDVACPSADSCTAMGDYMDRSDDPEGLIETLSDGTWRATEAPLPANGANHDSGDNGLVDLACPSVGSCTAVGDYDTSRGEVGLIETLSGETWTPTEAPLPANTDNKPDSLLSDVACSSAGSCTAVGIYHDSNAAWDGLIETLSGGTWTASEAPLPPDAATHDPLQLKNLACPSAGSCTAVGYYHDTSGSDDGLIETLSDGMWTASEAPLPADAANGPSAYLVGLACPSAGSCTAVGSYHDTGGNNEGLIETQQ